MARKFQSRARRVSKDKAKVWTANVFSELDPLATVTSVNLVEAADITPFAKLHLQTVRGWLHVQPFTTSILDDTFFAYLCVVDEDIGATSAAMLPTLADTYVDEDILYTWGCITTHDANGVLIGGGGMWFDINVKMGRIIRDGMTLRFVFANLDGTGEQIVSGVFRTLLHTS